MTDGLLMFVLLAADSTASLSLVISILGLVVSVISAVAATAAAVYSKRALGRSEPEPKEKKTKQPKRAGNRLYDIGTPVSPPDELEVSQASAAVETQISSQVEAVPAAPVEISTDVPIPVAVAIPAPALAPTPIDVPVSAAALKQPPVPAQPEGPHIPIFVEGEAMGEEPLELLLTVEDPSVRVIRIERLSGKGKVLGSSPCKPADKPLVFKCTLALEKVVQWWDSSASSSEDEATNILRVYLLVGENKKEISRDVPVSIVEGLRNVGIASLVVWTIRGSI